MAIRFPYAEQPDIIRAAQKDEFYQRVFNTQAYDITIQSLGPRTASKYKDEFQLLSDFVYFGMSTLLGQQTLGEEYCDIMQIKEKRLTALLFSERFLLLIWQVLIPYGLNKLVHRLEILAQPQMDFGQVDKTKFRISEEKRLILEKNLPTIVSCIDIIKRIHVAIFYFSGVFYDFAKRVLGIRYLYTRPLEEQRPSYAILGLLIFLQLGISLIVLIKQSLTQKKPEKIEMKEENLETVKSLCSTTAKCSLCLEVRQNPTATECGHIFCWNCIHQWCNTKLVCPLCRSQIKKSNLVAIYGI